MPIQTQFIQSQIEFFGKQMKSLGEDYAKAASEMLNASLKTND